MSQQVNLYNPAFEQKKKLFGAAAMAQGLLVLVLGCALLAVYGQQRVTGLRKEALSGAHQVEALKARLEQVTREFPARQKSAALQAELEEAQAQLASLHRIAGVLERGELGNTSGYSEYFRAFARQRVDGLWLTGLVIQGVGTDITVHGRALDPSLVPGYLARLTNERALQGKAFGSLQIGEPQAKDAKAPEAAPAFVEFTLQATPEGAPR